MLRTVLTFLLGLSGYYLFSQLGLLLTTPGNSSAFWPATGFAIAFLGFFGLRYSGAIFLGTILTNIPFSLEWFPLLLGSTGKTLEAIVSVLALSYFNFFENHKPGSPTHLRSQIFAPIISPILGAFVGASIAALRVYLSRDISSEALLDFGLTWWTGDTLGGLIVFPLIYGVFERFRDRKTSFFRIQEHIFEPVYFTILLSVCFFVFGSNAGSAFAFLLFPALLIFALKKEGSGVRFAVAFIASFAVIFTAYNNGPFWWQDTDQNLISLQIFLFSLGVTTIALHAFKRFLSSKKTIALLIVGWFFSGTIFYLIYTAREKADSLKFEELARDGVNQISRRINTYEDLLRGGVGLFLASDDVTKQDWKKFVESLDIFNRHPGIKGLSFIARVPMKDVPLYEKRQQRKNPHFKVHSVNQDPSIPKYHSESGHDDAYIVQYIEPLSENLSALGLEISSEATRLKSINEALQSGNPTITDKITLVQDQKKLTGFVIYAPIKYSKSEIGGFIAAPFVLEHLMRVLDDEISNEVSFSIFAGKHPTKESLLYDSTQVLNPGKERPLFSKKVVNTLTFGQKSFTLVWKKTSAFVSSHSRTLPWVGIVGGVLTLISAWLYISTLIFRERAEVLVKLKTKELSERELIWRTLMQSIPAGVFQTDRNGIIQYSNPKWINMVGKSEADVIGKHWMTFAHLSEVSLLETKWDEAIKEKQNLKSLFRYVNAQEKIRWNEIILSPLTSDKGEVQGFVGINIDVTERIKIQNTIESEQRKLAHTSKMASLGEMAAGIAHEINNPLAIILGKSGQLKRHIEDGDIEAEYFMKNLTKIESTVERIDKIVKGLRAFSRNSEKDPMESVPISQLIEDALTLSADRFRDLEVKLIVNPIDEKVICRFTEILQVLFNLLSNALDAVDHLSDKWVKIEVQKKDSDYVKVSVIDSGSGISKKSAEKIMQPFFTTKDAGKGTGLGLSISKRIIEDHGGIFGFDLSNKNTKFYFTLPIAKNGDPEI